MGVLKSLSLAAVVMLGVAPGRGAGEGDYYTSRQYYSTWQKHPQRAFYYRSYYYKPTADYVGYKHHYVVYYPSRPTHLYFYNPYKKVYWGRCPIHTNGQRPQ